MKKLSIIVFSLFSFCNVFAQQRTQRMSTVTINVIGNKNTQVAVDGSTYTLAAGTNSGKATITNLAAGMHTLVLTRTNNNRRSNDVTTQFNLRRNFDMTINVTANGALELIETRKGAGSGTGTTVRSAMSDADFYALSRNVRAQRTVDTRNAYLTNTFNTNTTYLSSKQVADLMRQVSTSTEAQRLQLAKLSYRTVVDPNNFYQVINLFTNSTSRYDLEDYVYYYDEENNTGTGGTVGSDYPGTGTGMSQANFTSLYNTIRGQFPVTTQVNAINNAFTTSGNYFTAYQAGQLIQLVSNESYRMQLAKASYRTIVDPTNFYTVRDLLYTQAARNELEAWVSSGATGTGTGTVVRTAMSDIDYNNLYESINSQFLPFAQMNALTTTFNNASYYFTTAQVEKLIQLVSSETNRLTLAKAAYRNTVDRANYPNLYDLFTTTSYRNDLVAYTQAYRD